MRLLFKRLAARLLALGAVAVLTLLPVTSAAAQGPIGPGCALAGCSQPQPAIVTHPGASGTLCALDCALHTQFQPNLQPQQLIVNGGFENGLAGWDGNPRDIVHFAHCGSTSFALQPRRTLGLVC